MRLSIEVTEEAVLSIARCLNADAGGLGYHEEDGEARDQVLVLLVNQAAVVHGVIGPETAAVVRRDYESWAGSVKRRGKVPRARHIAPR